MTSINKKDVNVKLNAVGNNDNSNDSHSMNIQASFTTMSGNTQANNEILTKSEKIKRNQ